MLVHEQSRTEHLLYDYPKENGKDVWWQTALETLKQDEHHATATPRNSVGDIMTVEARYVAAPMGAVN